MTYLDSYAMIAKNNYAAYDKNFSSEARSKRIKGAFLESGHLAKKRSFTRSIPPVFPNSIV